MAPSPNHLPILLLLVLTLLHNHIISITATTNNNNNNNNQQQQCSYSQSQDLACPNDPNNNNNNTPFPCTIGPKPLPSDLFPQNSVLPTTHTLPPTTCNSGTHRYHCDCHENELVPGGPSGYTGCYCETPVRICPNNLVCYHGAPCVRIKDSAEYVCGCPYATTGGGGGGEKKKLWVGDHCELEGTNRCEKVVGWDVTFEREWFCTDFGTCWEHSDPNEKCQCETGYTGLHCELSTNNTPIKKNPSSSCDITCVNNGVCTQGVKKTIEHIYYTNDDEETNGNGNNNNNNKPIAKPKENIQITSTSYCVCPYPYKGKYCEDIEDNQIGSSSSSESSNPCGGCSNNAVCRFASSLGNGGNGDGGAYYCDCNTVGERYGGDDDDDDDRNTVYAGKKCEFEHSVLCPVPIGDDPFEYFCTNGGICPKEFHEHCTCPDNFTGPRCEFPKSSSSSSDPTTPTCPLPCKNNGKCFFGSNPEIPFTELDFNDPKDSAMHCKCPEGYTGFLCETKIDVCGEGRHVCANGGTCVKDGNDWECDCLKAIEDGVQYDGPKCEHEATSKCRGRAGELDWYCTNKGECRPYQYRPHETEEAKCDCPVGYTGDHCEEEKIDVCEGGTHLCKNGGVCVKDDMDWLCDCTKAKKDDGRYVGDFCEMPATSICEGGYADGRKGKNREWFCANGGVCKEEYGLTDKDEKGSSPGCNCKPGFTGEFCEDLIEEVCGVGTHRCYNGGSCVKDGEDWICDCSNALKGETPYRGEKCENPATSYCVGEGGFLEGFCTNGGTCKDAFETDGKKHPGCICKPAFVGEFCEFLNVERTNGVARKAFWGISISALSIGFIYMAWSYANRHNTIDRNFVPTGVPDYDSNYNFGMADNTLEMVVADEDVIDDNRLYGVNN